MNSTLCAAHGEFSSEWSGGDRGVGGGLGDKAPPPRPTHYSKCCALHSIAVRGALKNNLLEKLVILSQPGRGSTESQLC